MATGYSSADRLRDVDYSRSHRSPPPVPPSPSPSLARSPPRPSTPARKQREAFSAAVATAIGYRSEGDHGPRERGHTTATAAPPAWPIPDDYPAPASTSTLTDWSGGGEQVGRGGARSRAPSSASEGGPGRPRRASLNFLRRSNTNNSSRKASIDQPERAFYTAEASAPPLPTKVVVHVQQDAPVTRKKSGSMLRKVSGIGGSRRRQEQRQKREAAAAAAFPREAPHLPSLSPLTGMSPFSEERPDSVAIFGNHSYTTSSSTSPPVRPTANFSRPSQHAMPMSPIVHSSSPPGYSSGRADSALVSSSPPPHRAKPNGIHSSGEYVATDVLPDSMTNRGRFSYASTVTNVNAYNSPRRIRRKKDPTPFNILVIGAKSSGKTSFISFLKHSLSLPPGKQPHGHEPDPEELNAGLTSSSFTSAYLESEIDGERIGLTLWDSKGLEKNVVDLQCRELAAFVESKFEETFAEEQKVMRTPGVKDTHIHCVFLMLDPVRLDNTIAGSTAHPSGRKPASSLDDDLDLQVMRALWGKTTVVPIVGKADTLTTGHMAYLKRAVWDAVKSAKLDPLEALELEDDSEDDSTGEADDAASGDDASDSSLPLPKARPGKSHKRQSSLSIVDTVSGDTPYLPMSVFSPDLYDLPPYAPPLRKGDKVGRRYPWGFADPHDAAHCDFGRLRDSVFSEWRVELRELSRSRWYENWRTSRLKNLPGTRQRIQGGVTPVASVPRGGRIASQPRQASLQPNGPDSGVAERNLSSVSNSPSIGASSPSPIMSHVGTREVSGASVTSSVRGGASRNLESNIS